ncbi:MAG: hypothetical protein LAO76_15285 [Acidobacteriia bacterium]|nr:hypothetical protein [Terriglobia bacterium]
MAARIKRILFPFSSLFQRLNLKQHWWHRLFVLLFSLGLAGYTVIICFATYVNRFTLVDVVDVRKLAKDLFPKNVFEPINEYRVDFYYGDDEFLRRVQAGRDASVPMMSPDEKSTKMVPREQVEDAKRRGWTRAFKTLSPAGKPGWVSAKKIGAAQDAGYQVVDIFDELLAPQEKPTLDMSTFRPCCPENWNVRTVDKVAVIAFPKDMPESAVGRVCQVLQDRFRAADRRTDVKRWFICTFYCLPGILLALYTPQILYRLFLYFTLSPEALSPK